MMKWCGTVWQDKPRSLDSGRQAQMALYSREVPCYVWVLDYFLSSVIGSDSIYVRLGVVGDRHLCGCVREATANFLCRVEPVTIKIPDGEIEGCVVVHRITCGELAGDDIFRLLALVAFD